MRQFFRDYPVIGVIGVVVLLIFAVSPFGYALGRWHCYWMPHVPVCQ